MQGQRNDRDWIWQALEKFERPLIQYAYRLTGDRETARDVVQDTFLKLCAADAAKLNGHLAPWLFTVCRNRAYDVCEKRAREKRMGNGHTTAAPIPTPHESAERVETQRIIIETVETLPKEQQQVFRLKFDRGLSYREISKETGFALATVSKHLHAAMSTLRAVLHHELETDQLTEASSHEV